MVSFVGTSKTKKRGNPGGSTVAQGMHPYLQTQTSSKSSNRGAGLIP